MTEQKSKRKEYASWLKRRGAGNRVKWLRMELWSVTIERQESC